MKQLALLLKLDLQRLILILIILCVSCLFIVSVFILNYVIKAQLIENSLSINDKYASKVALSTDQYFRNMLQELKYSSDILGKDFSNQALVKNELHRLKFQSNNFNSVSVVDQSAHIRHVEPQILKFDANATYKTMGIVESLKSKQTYISAPYQSMANNLIVLMSQPIFTPDHQYRGMVTGSLYLQKKNLISQILATSYSYKNSYMYVVDSNNKIIFHPEAKRIGETIQGNSGLDYMKQHKSGHIRLQNSKGVDNLAGFAHIPSVNWLVVSQQPTEVLFAEANTIIHKVALGFFIFYMVLFFFIWKIAQYISSPLHGLAQMAGTLNKPETENEIQKVDPWYFEVMRFRTALLFSSKKFRDKISELNLHVNTDPLTGLHNRRGMQLFLDELQNMGTEFSVLIVDIDYFKLVNDQFGHDQGDQMLKVLAEQMKKNFRENDVCCRMGGEEFAVLMTTADREVVYKAAERLRQSIEGITAHMATPITISIGIASWPVDAQDVKDVFKLADNRLYQAKNEGRNRVCC